MVNEDLLSGHMTESTGLNCMKKILLWQVQHSGCISWATSSRL